MSHDVRILRVRVISLLFCNGENWFWQNEFVCFAVQQKAPVVSTIIVYSVQLLLDYF